MSALPRSKFTVDEFLAWAEHQPGRYELLDGEILAMSPERSRHALIKFAIANELGRAVKQAGLSCIVYPDGMTIRIDKSKAFEPDALVRCGTPLDDDAIEVPDPLIVVEVLSPSTRDYDVSYKLAGYFQVPSIQHYLIIDPKRRPVVHHQRQADGTILTRLVQAGVMRLDPPGLDVDTDAFFH